MSENERVIPAEAVAEGPLLADGAFDTWDDPMNSPWVWEDDEPQKPTL